MNVECQSPPFAQLTMLAELVLNSYKNVAMQLLNMLISLTVIQIWLRRQIESHDAVLLTSQERIQLNSAINHIQKWIADIKCPTEVQIPESR